MYTYFPVVKWKSIILVLLLVCLMGWSTTQIDYVLAFTQAQLKCDFYTRIQKGLDLVIENEGKSIVQGNPNDYVVQVHINVYRSKLSGRVLNEYLTKKIIQ